MMILASCANLRPSKTINGNPVAYDSLAGGDVKVSATKRIEINEVCFDINVSLRGTSQQEAMPRNWSLAWVDKKNQYHLLSLNQRDPASVPQGGQVLPRSGERNEWFNTFRTCVDRPELDDVKGIVLTPKELPFDGIRSLRLEWQ